MELKLFLIGIRGFQEMNSDIESYIQSLQGTKYEWWTEGPTGSNAPFYASNDPVPSLQTIQSSGLNCAGFINLIRRYQHLDVAGVEEELWNAGGTYVWFRYFQQRNVLEPFEPNANYPAGTLLLRDYTSVFDQGHLAVCMGLNRIAHCYPDDPLPVPRQLVEPGVRIEPLNLSMNWDTKGYYTHVVKPEWWLRPSSLCRTPSQTE